VSENEPMGLPVIAFDEISEIKIIAEVARISLVERRNGNSEPVGRLMVPVTELPEVIQALTKALAEVVRTVINPRSLG
jgi:predicted transcriptional regulator